MSERRRVFSSHINSIGYDAESGELTVEFGNGSTVVYSGVPPNVADNVLSAPSIGEAVWGSLRGRYDFSYLNKAGRR